MRIVRALSSNRESVILSDDAVSTGVAIVAFCLFTRDLEALIIAVLSRANEHI